MIDSIFILSGLGEVLIEKHYRHGTLRSSIADLFWERATVRRSRDFEDTSSTSMATAPPLSSYNSGEHANRGNYNEPFSITGEDGEYGGVGDDDDDVEIPPVVLLSSSAENKERFAVHIKRGDLTFVAGISRDTSPTMAIEFLHRVADILKDYLGEPDEVKIKDAFSTVYQVLDEMMDGGMPLVTEFNALKGMIAVPTVANMVKAVVMGGSAASALSPNLPLGAVSTNPWRDKTISYLQNEIFLDVEEYLDCVLTGEEEFVSADVHGAINITTRLTGMPEVLLSFEDADVLGDVSFHPCVRIDRWEREKVLSFIPPDGSFELMRYRAAKKFVSPSNVADAVPFYCRPSVTVGAFQSPSHGSSSSGSSSNATDGVQMLQGRMEILLGPRKRGFTPISSLSSASPGIVLEDVSVRLPLPSQAKFLQAKANEGKVGFSDRTCVWTIGKYDLEKTALRLTGSFSLPQATSSSIGAAAQTASGVTTPSQLISTTASLSFSFQSRPVSGLKVANLEITNQTYKYFKGVKSILKAGEFQVRC